METSGFGASKQTSKKARDISRDAHSHYSHLGLSNNWEQPTKETDWEKMIIHWIAGIPFQLTISTVWNKLADASHWPGNADVAGSDVQLIWCWNRLKHQIWYNLCNAWQPSRQHGVHTNIILVTYIDLQKVEALSCVAAPDTQVTPSSKDTPKLSGTESLSHFVTFCDQSLLESIDQFDPFDQFILVLVARCGFWSSLVMLVCWPRHLRIAQSGCGSQPEDLSPVRQHLVSRSSVLGCWRGLERHQCSVAFPSVCV